jgi:predicted outer membrane protein
MIVRVLAMFAFTVLAVMSPITAAVAHAAPGDQGGSSVSQSDQDVLTMVMQSGMWEIAAGGMARNPGSAAAVRTAAATLVTDDTALNQQAAQAAEKLGVQLPGQPDSDQQGWLAQLHDEAGATFDHDYVNLVRQANGKVFTAVAAARAGTKNDLIKQFAQSAVDLVMKHMTVLEATKLVDSAALPDPALPQTTDQAPAGGDAAGQGGAVTPTTAQVVQQTNTTATPVDDRPSPAVVLVGVLLIGALAWATVMIIRRVVNSA